MSGEGVGREQDDDVVPSRILDEPASALWQPIATAPRDGTWVLLYSPKWPITCYALVGWSDGPGEEWQFPAHPQWAEEMPWPTHWQWLPELPGESTPGGGSAHENPTPSPRPTPDEGAIQTALVNGFAAVGLQVVESDGSWFVNADYFDLPSLAHHIANTLREG